MKTRAEKEARVKELDKQIREYPYLGAFLTAADEERLDSDAFLVIEPAGPDPIFKTIAIGGIVGALCLIALCIYKVATLT